MAVSTWRQANPSPSSARRRAEVIGPDKRFHVGADPQRATTSATWESPPARRWDAPGRSGGRAAQGGLYPEKAGPLSSGDDRLARIRAAPLQHARQAEPVDGHLYVRKPMGLCDADVPSARSGAVIAALGIRAGSGQQVSGDRCFLPWRSGGRRGLAEGCGQSNREEEQAQF